MNDDYDGTLGAVMYLASMALLMIVLAAGCL